MIKSLFYFIVFSYIVATSISCKTQCITPQNTQNSTNSLIGAWYMQEVHWKTVDTTYSIINTQPGIFIFTENDYSIMWTPTKKQRTPFKILSKPTDKELISGFRSVVFNSGTYSYTDSTVISTAVIAKVPGFEGGKQFYRYNIENNNLTITMFDETYPDGTRPEWFGKYITQFVLIRHNNH